MILVGIGSALGTGGLQGDLWFKLLLASAKPPGLVAPGMARRLRSEIDARFGTNLLGEPAKSCAVDCFRHIGLAAEHCWRPHVILWLCPRPQVHASRLPLASLIDCALERSEAGWGTPSIAPDLRRQRKS
jgi:hypothetical protein